MTIMFVWNLLFLLFLQSSPGPADSSETARELSVPAIKVVPLAELEEQVAAGEFVPVPGRLVPDILAASGSEAAPVDADSQARIREARYAARMTGTRLEEGTLEFEMYAETQSRPSGPLLIGATSLQDLKLSDPQGSVRLGADAGHRLFVLRPATPGRLSGSWSAEGLVAGNVVTFRLELPPATISRFSLRTPAEIQVSSAGSLVLGPQINGKEAEWTLIPGDAAKLTFSCRTLPDLSLQRPLPIATFSSSHTVSADLLLSRWTIGLPVSQSNKTVLTFRVPENVRIADVTLEDRRPIEWGMVRDNLQQFIRMVVPASAQGAGLSFTGTSVLPLTEAWNLPMISPGQWQSEDGQYRGAILLPPGQMTVVLPAAVELDEWILVGVQERDVVSRPDQSREYQLVQYLPEASAVLRTSTSQSRISDAVVTVVEPAGRLATVRCLVNVRCEGASVVQLEWPVSSGWQVISSRYASDRRSLFFENGERGDAAETPPLKVHLPEALEPGTSRVIEIRFQQTASADPQSLMLPLLAAANSDRASSLVVLPPAFSMNSDLQRRWGMGRQTFPAEEIRRLAPWFPESRPLAGMQLFESGNSLSVSANVLNQEMLFQSNEIQIEHSVRMVDGSIVENSRLVFPADFSAEPFFRVAVPANSGVDLRWSVSGEPVAAVADESSPRNENWSYWQIPSRSVAPGATVVVRCESRRPVAAEFTAAIPVPQSSVAATGTLQLFSSDEGILKTSQLDQKPGSTGGQSTSWQLADLQEQVLVTVDQNQRVQAGQTIDVHMLHLITEQNGGLYRNVLAVANVARSSGKEVLQVSLPVNTRPLVLVNGHRVHLAETEEGLAVPLPPSLAECQIMLTWTERAEEPDKVTGIRYLPRLFTSEQSASQSTHHILVQTGLELHASLTPFAASDPTEISSILEQIVVETASDGRIAQSQGTSSIPAEIRQFVIRWQLATTQGWKSQTLIDSLQSENPVAIRVTQIRRKTAIASGTFLLLLGATVGFRHLAARHRIVLACVACMVILLSQFVQSQIVCGALVGGFWGLSTGLIVAMVTRWRRLRSVMNSLFVRSVAGLIFCLCSASTVVASPQAVSSPSASVPVPNQADFIVPEAVGASSDIVYVRRRLLDLWRQKQLDSGAEATPAVLTSLHSCIIAESIDSIELRLTLEVAAASGRNETSLEIPLHGSHLVECLVDGKQCLPEASDSNSIRIPLPASVLVPQRELSNSSSPEKNAVTWADAEAMGAFSLHAVELRLRPVASRQASGVQFKMPGLPCPANTVEVVCSSELFSSARAHTPEGVVTWNPSEGVVPLKNLSLADGIDLRLFQVGIEKGSPQLASVRILAVNENVSGQQILTCVSRFSNWNSLTPDVRYRVPNGYQLTSVTASTGADVVTDLLWSVKDQNALIQLPAGIRNEFVLSLQLVSMSPLMIQNQQVPVDELQQFPDCVAATELLLAVRANTVFSVLPIEGSRISTVAFSALQGDWGQWLRRSDLVFRIPAGNPFCVVRLVPKTSVNEVHLSQDIRIGEGQVDWIYQIDVETDVLPVFRHRLKISSEIVISDVQVVAGEANRLDSWHRRGDQLVIQLKEGTTGLHGIRIQGSRLLRPDDVKLTLFSPHLQNAEILESSMTLLDQDGLGLSFAKLGGAASDTRIQVNDLLQPGTSVRMVITDDSDPVVLQRVRPVNPAGDIAVIPLPDQVVFAVRISQWSGSLGPLQMTFPADTSFVKEPVVIADGKRLSLVRSDNEFVADQTLVKALFDQPEFTVVWSMPLPLVSQGEQKQAIDFAWPEIFEGIQWSRLLLIPGGGLSAKPEPAEVSASVPEWLIILGQTTGEELVQKKANAVLLPVASSINKGRLQLSSARFADLSAGNAGDEIVAVSDSIVWLGPKQSAVGETNVLLFSSRTPSRCVIEIPDEIVVTEFESAESSRWEDTDRKRLLIEGSKPFTEVKMRWLSKNQDDGFLSARLNLHVPSPIECTNHMTLTVVSERGQSFRLAGAEEPQSSTELIADNLNEIKEGLSHANSTESQTSLALFDPLPSDSELNRRLTDSREKFLNRFLRSGRAYQAVSSCRLSESAAVMVLIDRQIEPLSIISLTVACAVLLVAVFARNTIPASESSPLEIDALPPASHDLLSGMALQTGGSHPGAEGSTGSASSAGLARPISKTASSVNQPGPASSSAIADKQNENWTEGR